MAARTPEGGGLGPAMPLPESPPTADHWINDFPACNLTKVKHPPGGGREVPVVQPAWVDLPSGDAMTQLSTTPLPDLRFFLRGVDEIRQRYLPPT